MYKSIVVPGGEVTFPGFRAERIYMVPFMQREGLSGEYTRWQSTVDQMLGDIKTDQPIYLMVDQAHVEEGKTHRRPGMHIDGYWNPALYAHTSGGGGHSSYGGFYPGSHSGTSYREVVREPKVIKPRPKPKEPPTSGPVRLPGPRPQRPHHLPKRRRWDTATFADPEAIIIASSIEASEAYAGAYTGFIGDGGDASAIDLRGLERIGLSAGRAYVANVSALHQATPMPVTGYRTLVRLNVPGYSPEL